MKRRLLLEYVNEFTGQVTTTMSVSSVNFAQTVSVSRRHLGRTEHLSKVSKSDTLQMDIVTPFPESKRGNSYILVIGDYSIVARVDSPNQQTLLPLLSPSSTPMHGIQQHCQSHYELLPILPHVWEKDTHAN